MFYQIDNKESNAIIQERLPLKRDGSLNQLNSKHHYQQYPREIIMSNSQQSIPHQLEINPPNNITRSNTETTPPALQIPMRIPQALKCLADFNNPGLHER